MAEGGFEGVAKAGGILIAVFEAIDEDEEVGRGCCVVGVGDVECFAVDDDADEADGLEILETLTPTLSHGARVRSESEHEAGAGRERGELVGGCLRGAALNAFLASRAEELGNFRVEQPKIVDGLGSSADSNAVGARGTRAADGDGGGKPVDAVGFGLVEAFEELAGVEREGFDVAALAFGVERVEGEAGFAAAADTTDDDELVAGNVEVDVLEIVDRGTAQFDMSCCHGGAREIANRSLIKNLILSGDGQC